MAVVETAMTGLRIMLAPSILAADFARLGQQVALRWWLRQAPMSWLRVRRFSVKVKA
jgi:hypothetical protein